MRQADSFKYVVYHLSCIDQTKFRPSGLWLAGLPNVKEKLKKNFFYEVFRLKLRLFARKIKKRKGKRPRRNKTEERALSKILRCKKKKRKKKKSVIVVAKCRFSDANLCEWQWRTTSVIAMSFRNPRRQWSRSWTARLTDAEAEHGNSPVDNNKWRNTGDASARHLSSAEVWVMFNWRHQPALALGVCFLFFLNEGNTEGTNSSKMLCLMFVYNCFFYVCVRTDFVNLREFVVWWHVRRITWRQTKICS